MSGKGRKRTKNIIINVEDLTATIIASFYECYMHEIRAEGAVCAVKNRSSWAGRLVGEYGKEKGQGTKITDYVCDAAPLPLLYPESIAARQRVKRIEVLTDKVRRWKKGGLVRFRQIQAVIYCVPETRKGRSGSLLREGSFFLSITLCFGASADSHELVAKSTSLKRLTQ